MKVVEGLVTATTFKLVGASSHTLPLSPAPSLHPYTVINVGVKSQGWTAGSHDLIAVVFSILSSKVGGRTSFSVHTQPLFKFGLSAESVCIVLYLCVCVEWVSVIQMTL